jgi:hypothetical protein
MENEILYKFAEDSNGKIVNINNAVTGTNYICPSCIKHISDMRKFAFFLLTCFILQAIKVSKGDAKI